MPDSPLSAGCHQPDAIHPTRSSFQRHGTPSDGTDRRDSPMCDPWKKLKAHERLHPEDSPMCDPWKKLKAHERLHPEDSPMCDPWNLVAY